MLESIMNYVKGLFHTIKKDDVLENIENTFTGIRENVIPAIDQMLANSDLSGIKNNKLLVSLGVIIKTTGTVSTLKAIKELFEELDAEYNNFYTMADKNLPNVITTNAITVRASSILYINNAITIMTLYVLDFLYMSVMSKDTEYPRIKTDEIKNNVVNFGRFINDFRGNFKKMIKEIPEYSDAEIAIDAPSSLQEYKVGQSGKIPQLPANNFVGNPIYSIRLWLVDKEIAKYDRLQDKKRLLELRLFELQQEADHLPTDKIRKQILVYEKEIKLIEKDIEKIKE